MKEQKLFEMVRHIDEELISGAAEYMPSHNTQKQDEGETVYISAVRVNGTKKQIRRYSAAALALLAAAGGTVFVFNYGDGLKNNLDFPSQVGSSEEQTAFIDVTAETEQETDTPDVTKPVEEVKTITPLKIECLDDTDVGHFFFPSVVYVDSDPEIPYKSFDDE